MNDTISKKTQIRRFVTSALRTVDDVAQVLPHIIAKPSIYQVAAIGLRSLKLIERLRGREGFDYNGLELIPHSLKDLYRVATTHGKSATIHEREQENIVEITLHGVSMVWDVSSSADPEGPYVRDRAAAFAALGRVLWEHYGARIRVEPTENYDEKGHNDEYVIERDEQVQPLPSQLATKLSERIRKFRAAGYSRALLIVGPPGTGKSTCMRAIVAELGGMSLRVSLQRVSMSSLVDICAFMRPDFVLIEDIDRSELEHHLESIERLRMYTHVLMATCNEQHQIEAAARRPGRFDEVYSITTADKSIIDALLAGIPKGDARKLAEGLPAAFIDEFVRRAKVLGPDIAAREVEALAERADSMFRRKMIRRRKKVRLQKQASEATVAPLDLVNDGSTDQAPVLAEKQAVRGRGSSRVSGQ